MASSRLREPLPALALLGPPPSPELLAPDLMLQNVEPQPSSMSGVKQVAARPKVLAVRPVLWDGGQRERSSKGFGKPERSKKTEGEGKKNREKRGGEEVEAEEAASGHRQAATRPTSMFFKGRGFHWLPKMVVCCSTVAVN
jgi:hypothetical protein